MISTQELRRDVEGIESPTPQPEDPGRSLDPASEEDPDIFVELEEGVFYQASYDGTEVAIMADYPGLLPASKVTEIEVPVLSRGSIHAYFDCRKPIVFRFAGEILEVEGRARGG